MKRAASLSKRFHEKYVVLANGCWQWIGTIHRKSGYGYLGLHGADGRWTTTTAHRVSYYLAHGRWPLTTDHLCRNHACVNPDHLESVSHRTNCMRGISPTVALHRRGVCARGHPAKTEAFIRKEGRVAYCRACVRERYAVLRVSD